MFFFVNTNVAVARGIVRLFVELIVALIAPLLLAPTSHGTKTPYLKLSGCTVNKPLRGRTLESASGVVDMQRKVIRYNVSCSNLKHHVPHTAYHTLQLHINLGLTKLRETQAGVEDMQKGLAEKERRLR